MKKVSKELSVGAAIASLALASSTAFSSSHMDAPLITLDDAANTTDVYAFVSGSGDDLSLTTALAVYPFEEPGIGPNNYRFDDNVLYEIHVALGRDVARGRKTISYQFEFDTGFKNKDTILQAFLPLMVDCTDLEGGFPRNQNLRQTYKVTKVDHRRYKRRRLGKGRVPPNNQGLVTPAYNMAGGEGPAIGGVDFEAALDDCTKFGITDLSYGHKSFAGQRDDGFYADIQSIFDLDFTFGGPNKPFDSQGGFNVHTIVLDIPLEELGGSEQVVGVFATTSRKRKTVLSSDFKKRRDRNRGRRIQVGRQGNPLFNEALVAIKKKDLYNRTSPRRDRALFRRFALEPELAAVLNAFLGTSAVTTDRTDIAGIFIPDLIKVDLSTGPALTPGETGFNRLSVFGGDVLTSTVQPGFGGGVVPGGFPNGRRFGDDVLDITVCAVLSDLRDPSNLIINCNAETDIDKVVENDITYNDVFPYAATPLNGRNHGHH